MGESDSAEALMEAVRQRVGEVLRERPQDVGLSLRSAQILLRSAIAERKLSGRADRDLKGNLERVLQELGSQLLPADGPGE